MNSIPPLSYTLFFVFLFFFEHRRHILPNPPSPLARLPAPLPLPPSRPPPPHPRIPSSSTLIVINHCVLMLSRGFVHDEVRATVAVPAVASFGLR